MGCCCNNRAWDTVGIKGPKRVQLFWKAINGRSLKKSLAMYVKIHFIIKIFGPAIQIQ